MDLSQARFLENFNARMRARRVMNTMSNELVRKPTEDLLHQTLDKNVARFMSVDPFIGSVASFFQDNYKHLLAIELGSTNEHY